MSKFKQSLQTLTRTPTGALLVMASVTFLLTVTGYILTIKWIAPIPRDGTGMVVGRDFFNFWMFGRAAYTPDPGLYYNWPSYVKALTDMFGEDTGQSWSYPPSIMLLAAPFGRLPYMLAYLIWTVLATGIFWMVARRHFNNDLRLLLLALLSPAAMFCFMSGQSALLTTAMFLGIFALLDSRPLLAGVLIGCLSLKPQLGLMFPFMLLATRRWPTIASAALTTIVIAGLTALLFGPKVWVQFVTEGLPMQTWVLRDFQMQGAPFMPTIFMNARQLGLTYEQSLALQALFSVAAIATVLRAFRKHADGDKPTLFALFTACTVCGSPYMLSYDLMPMTVATIALMARGNMDAIGQRLMFGIYGLMMIQMALGMAHIPGPALLVPAYAAWLVLQLRGTARIPQTVAA